MSTTDRFGGLLVNKHQLARPNSHFQKIHPTDAAVSDGAMAAEKAKAEAKAKAAAAPKPTAPVTAAPVPA